ncbi:tyrosine-type recombinase/integrase [Bradyrhizobium diazoefficiens]|uniref:tyrosine-type recombinase/integrase n=1 Tax=Bradyrhizobium diazoefficiens TaxID=1355477 RepID=UPI0027154F84|nr:tyrosine-type recombinase/integrase [Bradyrhizobium diazoefficiens]WLC19328.1 tyrosine-type recombinase/integrase [Bradyrhizobium diazoefficiens]
MTVWYVRLGKGRRIRIKAAYGTPEFEAAYQAALRGELPLPAAKAPKGSLEWLWILYRQTSAWSDLSLATRKQRERIMRQVLATGGAQPLSNITPRAIQLGIERRKSFAARHFVDTLRGMFKWAVAAEHVRSDPTAGKAVPKAKSKGFPVWTEGDLEQFERRWPIGTRERVMFDVYLYTGLRRGDAARLGKQHIRDGVITIDTEKTGTRVTIPVLPELAETIAAGPTGELSIIASKKGQPIKKEVLGGLFKNACRAAGINKSAHGIRKAAATRAANNGATVATLEAIFGWEGGKMASLYTRAADRRALAAEHMTKLSKTGTSIPAPPRKVRAETKKG